MDMHVAHTPCSIVDGIAPISRQIWDAKYRLKDADGTPVDVTIEDTWRRVAKALAAAEREPGLWEAGSTRRWRISASCRPAASCPAPARTAA